MNGPTPGSSNTELIHTVSVPAAVARPHILRGQMISAVQGSGVAVVVSGKVFPRIDGLSPGSLKMPL